jgi:hypothetical protein
MNQHIDTRSPKPRLVRIQYVLAALLLLGLLLLWRELANTRKSLAEVLEQKSELAGDLRSTKVQLDQVKSGDSSPQTRERLEAARNTKAVETIKEETETLLLQAPTVEQTADGLTVRFGFEPDENIELPPSITLVVRVPGSSNSRIVALKAVGTGGSKVAPIVNATGNLGILEGSPAELDTLSFELTVTAPVKATVRGSEGIIDFELDITPNACTVRKL